MILDLDTGVDDALAIAYALATPDADLIGIAASYGNTLVDTAAENSLKLLELLGATDVPVYRGFSHSSTTDGFETMEISMDIHGKTVLVMLNWLRLPAQLKQHLLLIS
ncbi:Pyrimidine-specific ribonucleoside hydrolase rihA [Weissella viridescens]|uniref:Pyrimidine-specific ribonucleoside hydrolase rihA n=1 Tax=Weissella viridescens TaxID=1629 RepID=A0A380NYX9_WEIVI|nr:Pyrimidine-specific ribonucleoside hydrolase rihA [Weissella viridescens]